MSKRKTEKTVQDVNPKPKAKVQRSKAEKETARKLKRALYEGSDFFLERCPGESDYADED